MTGNIDYHQEAVALVLGHRRAYEEHLRHGWRPQLVPKVPFEVLETAYQGASQIMVALLVPKVHPWVPTLSRWLLRREYPSELLAPSLAVFVSGLFAKFALDAANLIGLPPFRWVEPRPVGPELLHPLSPLGLELNILGSIAGVCVGRGVVALRQGLRSFLEGAIGRLPARLWEVSAVALHLTASGTLSPLVVNELSLALREAQLSRRFLVPLAMGRIGSQFATGFLGFAAHVLRGLRLGGAAKKATDLTTASFMEVPWWDGVEEETVPRELICPITGSVFVRPVALHGMLFEEAAARRWVEATGRHPVLQNSWCHCSDMVPAKDVEALVRRIAAERRWALRKA